MQEQGGITAAGGHSHWSPEPEVAYGTSRLLWQRRTVSREHFQRWLWLFLAVQMPLGTVVARHRLELQSVREHEIGLKLSFLLLFTLSAKGRSATLVCVIDNPNIILVRKISEEMNQQSYGGGLCF